MRAIGGLLLAVLLVCALSWRATEELRDDLTGQIHQTTSNSWVDEATGQTIVVETRRKPGWSIERWLVEHEAAVARRKER